MKNMQRHQMSKHLSESQSRTDELTCKDCEKWKWCIESSREYPCISFRRKAVKEWQQKRTLKTKSKDS